MSTGIKYETAWGSYVGYETFYNWFMVDGCSAAYSVKLLHYTLGWVLWYMNVLNRLVKNKYIYN